MALPAMNRRRLPELRAEQRTQRGIRSTKCTHCPVRAFSLDPVGQTACTADAEPVHSESLRGLHREVHRAST